jgi:DNA invertase Pin-like site-specific DNA recombinase
MAAILTPRCAVYARSSFADPTCDRRLRELHEFVKKNGWQMYGDYVDLASPGSSRGRPTLEQLLQDAGRHLFACVVVSRVAHFASSAEMLYRRLRFLESHHVRFVAAAQAIDTQDETPTRCSEMISRVGRACLEFDSLRSR